MTRRTRRGVAVALPGIAVALLALLMVVVGAPTGGNGAAALPSGRSPTLTPAVLAANCTGTGFSGGRSGTLVNEAGNAPMAPVGGQTIELTYWITRITHSVLGTSPTYQCERESSTALTAASGAFTVPAPVLSNYCAQGIACYVFEGPFGPTGFTLLSNTSGDIVAVNTSGGSAVIDRISALGSVDVRSVGPLDVSTGAPIDLVAAPLTGAGTPSPANLTVNWTVAPSSAWDVLAESSGDLTLEALGPAALSGSVSLVATGSFNGSTLGPMRAAPVEIAAQPTVIGGGSDGPTVLDAGEWATIGFNATAAPGYTYLGTIDPGLGAPVVNASCQLVDEGPSLADVACQATVPIDIPGVHDPSVALTNGYSASTYRSLPAIDVAPTLSLTLTPSSPWSYPGRNVRFAAAVEAGTGVAPFGPACLTVAAPPPQCENAPAGRWNFTDAFPTTGNDTASVEVADATGATFGAACSVDVVPPPSVSAITLDAGEVPKGSNVSASALVGGGALPITYWWNASAPGATVSAGSTATDGGLSLRFAPGLLGRITLTLTAVDELGTRVSAVAELLVVPSDAVRIAVSAGPNGTTEAGSPVPIAYQAVDPTGLTVPLYDADVGIDVTGAPVGPLWVNGSGFGPLPSLGGGWFDTPTTAWLGGFLNITVAAAGVGNLSVTVGPVRGIADPAAIAVAVGPDRLHERLFAPKVGVAGLRSNATNYRISDRFGNPVGPGYIRVLTEFGGSTTTILFPILSSRGGTSVWVNYTAPSDASGVVEVLSESGGILLAPIDIPAVAAPLVTAAEALLLASAATAVGAVVVALRLRRRDAGAGRSLVPIALDPSDEDRDLKRLADGRAHVLARVPPGPPVRLEEIADGWTGDPPIAPEELAEWVGGLVREAVLTATLDADGRPVFARRPPGDPATTGGGLRIELDPEALERALSGRDEPSADGPGPGDPD